MLYNVPTIVLIGALLLVMIAVVEAGVLVGARFGETTWSNAHQVHTALTAAALALMGLMLAFTFNMSATRFETRRNVIVAEASAIQSVRNRIDSLAPAPRIQALSLLQDYLKQRIDFLEVGNNPGREQEAKYAARAVHHRLWRIAATHGNYAGADPQSRAAEYAGLTQALLDLNTAARQREAARARHVPEAVLVLLFALAIGSGAVLAYISGASRHPDRLPTYAVLCLICLVIYVVIDFDRPRRGVMRLDAEPLRELLKS